MEILELKNTSKIKNSIDGLHSRVEGGGRGKISKLEYRTTEIVQFEQKTKNRPGK